LAVPHKQKQKAEVAPSDNTAEPDRVDETVEDARMLLSRGQFQQALVALERLSPAPEGRVDFWLIKGSAHLAMGQLDSADKALASAQLLAPTNAQIAVQRAILQQEKGDHAAALEILKTAALRNPDVPEVFLNQGYSEQALGSVRDARRSFRIFLNITEGRSLYADQRESVNRWLAQFSSASN
jgi:tetratricopeptide (TPR) repeat protein